MANREVINYLNEGKRRGFSVHLLKKKLLEGGFDEREVNEAISIVEGTTQQVQTRPSMPIPPSSDVSHSSMGKEEHLKKSIFDQTSDKSDGKAEEKSVGMNKMGHGRTKWMKIGAWCGILLIVLGVIMPVIASISTSILNNSIFSLLAGVIFLVFFFMYFFGFAKLGRHTNEKMLKLGSWMIPLSFLAYIILSVIASFLVISQVSNFLIGGDLTSAKTPLLILSIAWTVLIIANVVGLLLFSVGLIRAGKQAKYAKAAGILNIVVFVIGLVFLASIVISLYSILNLVSDPSTTARIAAGGLSGGLVGILTGSISAVIAGFAFMGVYFFGLVAIVLGVLVLFNASKQFE